MKEPKVIVAGWCRVDPDKRDAVVASFTELVLRARAAPGCIDFAMSADPADESRYNLFELWRSEADLRAWRRVANSPKKALRMRRVEVQKHIVEKSGKPF
jgi:quinol monooxygenase YgiN